MITLEEERELLSSRTPKAVERLLMSHQRLVVSIARGYIAYGVPQADLIQEGMIGLLKSLEKYDASYGIRFASAGIPWIKCTMLEYIVRNVRMVKIATTKPQRKVFFNLRSMKQKMKATSPDSGAQLNTAQVKSMAKTLDVRPVDITDMELRLSGGDTPLHPPTDDGEALPHTGPALYEPETALQNAHQRMLLDAGLKTALELLDARGKRIVQARWINVEDDGRGAKTLHELAKEFNVTAERIRQIEVASFKKMKSFLLALRTPELAALYTDCYEN